jgi:hypothetical protein
MAVKIITHPIKLTGDTLHLDHEDVNQGKGTMIAVAPNPEMFPESYSQFHERALVIADLWNEKYKMQQILEQRNVKP